MAPSASRLGDGLLPIDWGGISPLRLRARSIAAGVFAGLHRSTRRGAGIEFGGQRPYVPGDDLRFLDLRSLLRHERLMIREFEMDTERALWLCLDGSASMAYRGSRAPGAKLAVGALLVAALARVAIAGGDPVGLTWLGGRDLGPVPPGSSMRTFERMVGTLEGAQASGSLVEGTSEVEACVRSLGRRAARGSVVVVISDLLDLPEEAEQVIGALGARQRAVVLVQLLDPDEADLGFRGKVRLVAIEGEAKVETDADAVRDAYQERLDALTERWRRAVQGHGGRLVRARSDDDPVGIVRRILQAAAEARR